MGTVGRTEPVRLWGAWAGGAIAAFAFLAALRLAVGAGNLPLMWDEDYALPIIERLWRTEWWVRAMLDYDDTKGPVFFWLYAAFGECFGRSAGTLRWLSILATAAWAATLCGLLDPRERTIGRLALVLLLALTLPYAMVMSQLVMSEPTFLLGCAAMAAVGVRALGRDEARRRLVQGPILFGLLLVLLLHHRIHVVALAGAIVLAALWRDRGRSWPWIAALLLAGLSRVPLWLRWGGLVGESFQHRYSVGLRLDSLAYLLAALAPTIGLALVVLAWRWRTLGASAWRFTAGAGAVGAALALLAPPAISGDVQDLRFAGPVATVLRPLADSPVLFRAAMTALAALGAMSLAAVMWLAWRGEADAGDSAPEPHDRSRRLLGTRLAALTILLGWLLSALAGGDVYDRYLLAFTFLWPLWCVRLMPPPLLAAQLIWQASFTALQVWSDLAPH